jgi:5-methylcytosine-specific restriction endonuclease McrA
MESISEGKVCTKCKVWLPFANYAPCSRYRDGHRSACRMCSKSSPERSRAYREKNKERLKAYRQAFRIANSEMIHQRDHDRYIANPEPKRARERARHARNPAIKRMNERARRIAKPDQWKAEASAWRAKNYQRIKGYQKISKARRRTAQGNFTAAEWRDLCARYGNKCLACGSEGPLTVDHVIPISKGGTNDITNLQPLCLSCNLHKHEKTIDYRT